VRTVVTGGAGFIGSHVVEALLARGDKVTVVDSFVTGSRENLRDEAALAERDIREDLTDAVAGAEVVFHLAAQADVGTSVERPEYDAEVNVLGTLRVLEAARAAGAQVVFSSTGGAIYGETARPAREDDPLVPISPYGTSKLAGEQYLASWNRLHGTHHVALRFANVYGARQLPKLEGGVVAIFFNCLVAREKVTIFGDGEQTRDFIYVQDVVAGMLAAVGHQGGVFNIGTGVETSVNELYDACRRAAGAGGDPEYAPQRLGDLLRSVVDPSLAGRELGWRPERSLDDGLRETWVWTGAALAS
jgi:UDP-glucose 4-epimerase